MSPHPILPLSSLSPCSPPPPPLCTLAEQRQPLHYRPLSHPHPILPLSSLSPCSPPSPCSLYSGRSGRAETAPTSSSRLTPTPSYHCPHCLPALPPPPPLCTLAGRAEQRQPLHHLPLSRPTPSYHCPYFLPALCPPPPLCTLAGRAEQRQPLHHPPVSPPPHLTIVLIVSLLSARPLLSVLWQVGQSRDSPYIVVPCLTPTPSYHCPHCLPALRPPPPLCTLAGRAEQRQPLHYPPVSPPPHLTIVLIVSLLSPLPLLSVLWQVGQSRDSPYIIFPCLAPPHLTIVLVVSLLSALPLLSVLWQVGQSRDSAYIIVPCLTPTPSYHCPHCLPALRPSPPLCTLAGRAGQRQPLHHRPLSHPHPILPLSSLSSCSPPSPSSLYSGRSGRAEIVPTSLSPVSPPPHLTIVLIVSLLSALPLLSVLWQVGQSRDSPYIVVPCLTPPHLTIVLIVSLLSPLPLLSVLWQVGQSRDSPYIIFPCLAPPHLTIVLVVSLLSALPLLSVLWQVGQSRDNPYIVVPCLTPTLSYHCPYFLPALRPPPALCTLAGRAEQRQPLHHPPLSHPHPILPLSLFSPCSPPSPCSLYSGRSGRAETAPTLSSPVLPQPYLTIVLIFSLLSALPLLSVLWQVGQSRDSPYIIGLCLTPTPSYHCLYFLPALCPPLALCTLAGRAEQRQPLHHHPLSHPHPILPLSLFSPCSPRSPCSLYSGRSGRAETAPTSSSSVSPPPHLTIVLIFSLLFALPLLSVLWQVGQSRDSPYIIVLCLIPTPSYHCPYFLPALRPPPALCTLAGRAEQRQPLHIRPLSHPHPILPVSSLSPCSPPPLLSVLWQVGQGRDSPYIILLCLTQTPSYHCPYFLPALRPPPPLCTLAGRAEQRQPLHCRPLSYPNPILPLSLFSPCSPPSPCSLHSGRSGRAETAPTSSSSVSPPPHLTIVLIFSLLSSLPLLSVL